ncbi:MAG TPA: hypothetical protein VEH07_05095 [Alphaproteobacteria bacterium]|nr:hypothetical protein [Alphaproteobacteria bacterium]
MGRGPKFAALVLSVALLASGSAERAAAADENVAVQGVELSAEQAQNLGVVTAPAKAATFTATISGFGAVIGVDTIVKSDSELLAARAAAEQSAASLRRARELAAGEQAAVSQDALSLAERQSAADEAAFALAQANASAVFGQGAAWLEAEKHDAIIRDLLSGSVALVRGTFPPGAFADHRLVDEIFISRIGVDLGAQSWTATQIWNAPADPNVPGRSFFALVKAPLAGGEHVAVSVANGAVRKGIIVPQAAIVLSDGIPWFYARTANGHYKRRQIDLSLAAQGGYFFESVAPGTPIVVAGAGLMLARELGPSAEAEE